MSFCEHCHCVPDTALVCWAERAQLSVPMLLRALTEVGDNDLDAVREWRRRQERAGTLGAMVDCSQCARLVVV